MFGPPATAQRPPAGTPPKLAVHDMYRRWFQMADLGVIVKADLHAWAGRVLLRYCLECCCCRVIGSRPARPSAGTPARPLSCPLPCWLPFAPPQTTTAG